MFPGINPRQLDQAMKKMGVKQEEIPASEVIIKSEGKDIVISTPKVVKVNMMGNESFQITGNIEERAAEVEISEEDVKTVADQAGVSNDQAREAINAANGDLAEAIMKLKKD